MTAPDLSLRGVKRRGNLFFRWCKTKAGLLRLRLAMTPIYVIARSKATWQSIFQAVQDLRWIASPSARNDHSLLSLRGASRRGNPYFRLCRTKDGLLRLRLAMTVGRIAMTAGMVRNDRSRFVIARSEATWQSIFQAVQDERWIASPSARNDGGADRNDGGDGS